MIKFTLIVPVYNVAPYLRECLDSVLSQTYKNWECICVDDGSTDGSYKILEEYAQLDCRFKIAHQKNKGVSAARNVGLSMIAGDVAIFLDGDDVLSENALLMIDNVFRRNRDSNAVVFRLGTFTDRPSDIWTNKERHDEVVYNLAIDYSGAPIHNFTCCAFKVDIIKNLIFGNHIIGEDILFLHQAMMRAARIVSIPNVLYGYRIRNGSAMQSVVTDQKLCDAIMVLSAILQDYEKSERIVPVRYWRVFCNSLIEDIPFQWLSLERDKREKVMNLWRAKIRGAVKYAKIPFHCKIRMKLIFYCPFVILPAFQLLQWMKIKGIHR